jgi:hypothetical protein
VLAKRILARGRVSAKRSITKIWPPYFSLVHDAMTDRPLPEAEWEINEQAGLLHHSSLKVQFLVKWCGLEYSDSTWEEQAELSSEADQVRGARLPGRREEGRASLRFEAAGSSLRLLARRGPRPPSPSSARLRRPRSRSSRHAARPPPASARPPSSCSSSVCPTT